MDQGEDNQSVPLVQSAQIVKSLNKFQSVNSVTLQPCIVNTSGTPTSGTQSSKTSNCSTLINDTHIPDTHVTNTPTICSPFTNKQNNRVFKVKSFHMKSHRRGKRKSVCPFTKTFLWLGNNIAGASSKWASVKRWVTIKSPVILSLQETKFQVAGKHKLDGYITYEHLRKEKTAGGGLLLAIKQELSPALVRDGGTDVEAITVDINIKQMQIVCSTAYGPQENDSREKKENFWNYLDEDVIFYKETLMHGLVKNLFQMTLGHKT